MLKKTLAVCAILLSTRSVAESAPDCSPDKDGRILNGIVVSLDGTKYDPYIHQLLKKDANRTIKLLSSREINTQEKKRLMDRHAKRSGFDTKQDIDSSGIRVPYMQNRIFRQYYDISTPEGLHLIAEYYSIPHYCGVDLESIYIVSDKIEGYTPNFADGPYSSY